MKALEEKAALLRRGKVAIGPEGGDAGRLAGGRRSVNLADGGFDLFLLAFELEGFQEIAVRMGAEEVGVLFGHAPGQAEVVTDEPAGDAQRIGSPGATRVTQHGAD